MARKKTIDIRKLSRRDAEQNAEMILEDRVVQLLQASGLKVFRGYTTKDRPISSMTAVGRMLDRDWQVNVEVKHRLDSSSWINRFVSRSRSDLADGKADQLWIIANVMHPSIAVEKNNYPDKRVRIMSLIELEELTRDWSSLRAPDRKPTKKKRAGPAVRTKIGKSVLKNGNELAGAATAALALIEQRMQELENYRPNSDEANDAKQDEVDRLTKIREQLKIIRDAPQALQNGEVKEKAVADEVNEFTKGVGVYWKKHSAQVCDKLLNFGLFTSLVLVAQLAGVQTEYAFGLSGVMVYGQPVVDGLKAMKGWFKGS